MLQHVEIILEFTGLISMDNLAALSVKQLVLHAVAGYVEGRPLIG